MLLVAWSKYDVVSQAKLNKRKKVSAGNLETNKLFERRPAEEESSELLQDDSEYRHKVQVNTLLSLVNTDHVTLELFSLVQRPYKYETLCRDDPSCPKGCDACCKLPYHNKTGDTGGRLETGYQEEDIVAGILDIHHGIAENWPFWNAHKRQGLDKSI